ncbi:hypothetical protein VQ042_10415 [Aurantimonas sp. A2-1-M11]|uniref:hypothetical protein n=1 Tax=Aurantimonas sp. A2-1-M11 TaxID=3113712 RepID=UPI002F927115
MAELLSERLLALLRHEVECLQAELADNIPVSRAARAAGAAKTAGGKAAGAVKRRAPAKAVDVAPVAVRRVSAKERVESIGQAARTLEKLLELKRLETLAGQGGGEDAAETARLREEFLSRLRSLDARRRAGATLFDAQTGAYAGEAGADDGRGAAGAFADAARRWRR